MTDEIEQAKELKMYMGVKLISAYPFTKDGQEGYNVLYPDGYASWSPKEAFEVAYMPLQMADKMNALVQVDIDQMIATAQSQQIDPKTTLLKVELLTGFCLYETASVVDPANYSDAVGNAIAMGKINSKIWFALGFLYQWAKYGLKNTIKQIPQEGEK